MIQPRLTLTLADRIDRLLYEASYRGLRVKRLNLSFDEFRALLDDPDGRDRYSDGHYRNIPIRIGARGRAIWTQ